MHEYAVEYYNISEMSIYKYKNNDSENVLLIILIIIMIIIIDSVDDLDQKPRYGIAVILNLLRYQPVLGNERINTKTNKYK